MNFNKITSFSYLLGAGRSSSQNSSEDFGTVLNDVATTLWCHPSPHLEIKDYMI